MPTFVNDPRFLYFLSFLIVFTTLKMNYSLRDVLIIEWKTVMYFMKNNIEWKFFNYFQNIHCCFPWVMMRFHSCFLSKNANLRIHFFVKKISHV